KAPGKKDGFDDKKGGFNAPAPKPDKADRKAEMHIFPLKYLPVTEAADVVEKFFQKRVVVAMLPRTNSLIVQGTEHDIREVMELIDRLERVSGEQAPREAPAKKG